MPPPVRNLQDPVILTSIMPKLRLPSTLRPVIKTLHLTPLISPKKVQKAAAILDDKNPHKSQNVSNIKLRGMD
jgi:hypothetical protein